MKRKTKDGWTEVVDAGGQVVATVDDAGLANDINRRHRHMIGLSLTKDLVKAIAAEAERQGVSRQALCVAFIRAGLERKRPIAAEPLPRGLAAATPETGEWVRAAKRRKGKS